MKLTEKEIDRLIELRKELRKVYPFAETMSEKEYKAKREIRKILGA